MRILIRGATEIEIEFSDREAATSSVDAGRRREPSAPAGEYVPVNPTPPLGRVSPLHADGEGEHSGTEILQPTAVEPAPVEAAERAPAKTSAAGSSAVPIAADPELARLLEQWKERWANMPEGEREAMIAEQRASWVRAEMAFGTDADEAAYRASLKACGENSPGVAIGADNPGGSHVDHQDDSPVEISAAPAQRLRGEPASGGVTDDCESPAAGEKAVPSAGGGDESRRLTEEPEEARTAPPATVLAEASVIALRMKGIGEAVTAAVANPPPPVVDPAPELPMRRPVEEDDLAFPDFLDRRRIGGGA